MPMIEIRNARLSVREQEILKNTGHFNWIVFTSSNGVTRFFEQLGSVTGSFKTDKKTKIAVIGKDTGRELGNFGHKADFISKISTGSAFAEELLEVFRGHKYKVLLPAGNLARRTVEERLSDTAEVIRLNVYNTGMPACIDYEALKLIQDDKYEMIIFTSVSGFCNFCLLARDRINLSSIRIACIGTTTAEAVTESGIRPLVTATEMNSEGIAKALIDYYRT
jgi:uroporphyrinogen-III synthase